MKTGSSLALLGVLLAPMAFAGVEEEFDYFTNNWNVVGLPDYMYGSRITPDDEIYLAGGMAVKVRVGGTLTPLSRKLGKKAREGWLPVIEVTANEGGVRYDIAWWATPLPDSKDWRKSFRWPVESENFLSWISVRATNTSSTTVEAKADARPEALTGKRKPTEFMTARKHTRVYAWTWKLRPGESAEGVARYPFYPVTDPAIYDQADARLWQERTVEFWRGLIGQGAHIEVPCRKATLALRAAHVCQLIANDLGDLRGGEGFYDDFYVRDGAYQLLELEESGFLDIASKAVEQFLRRQIPGGRFESQRNQWDANGQAVWALWQYAKISGDRAFLERVYPRMLRAVSWTMQERRKATADSPFAGLLSIAPADGEYLWDGTHHIVGYDFWNLRGMLCAADSARLLGRTEDAAMLMAEAQSYREAIDAAWKRTGLPHFPPSWEKAGTYWGGTETLWPTPLFAADDARVGATIDYVKKRHAGGYVEGTIRWVAPKLEDAIHPYMGAYTIMAELARGDHESVVESFYWYLLHSTAANAFPEGIFYKKREAWSDTLPHVTGACNYAILLRHMLVREEGDELHLLTAVPDWWLADGREIRLDRLPTHFGEMALVVKGTPAGVAVNFTAPTRNAPKRMSTKGGRSVLSSRRRKGRKRLTVDVATK